MPGNEQVFKLLQGRMTGAQQTAARCKSAFIHFKNKQTGETQYIAYLNASRDMVMFSGIALTLVNDNVIVSFCIVFVFCFFLW